MNWRWIQPAVVLAVHDRQIAEHGGMPGLRDPGLLAGALARPQNLAAYGRPDVADLAAAYAFGLIQDHPFLDGNKRTGYVVSRVFLLLHGADLAAPLAERVLAMLRVATGDLDEPGLAAWFRARSRVLQE